MSHIAWFFSRILGTTLQVGVRGQGLLGTHVRGAGWRRLFQASQAHLQHANAVQGLLHAPLGHIRNKGDPGWLVLGRGTDRLIAIQTAWTAARDQVGQLGIDGSSPGMGTRDRTSHRAGSCRRSHLILVKVVFAPASTTSSSHQASARTTPRYGRCRPGPNPRARGACEACPSAPSQLPAPAVPPEARECRAQPEIAGASRIPYASHAQARERLLQKASRTRSC